MLRQALQNLFAFADEDGQLAMGEAESEAKFDNLRSLQTLLLNGQSLTRLPSLKNLGKLEQFWISNNKITQIAAGAFKGASRLLQLTLQNNRITSVADGVFSDLAMLNVLPDGFAPTNAKNGSPWGTIFGIGPWVLFNAPCSRIALPFDATLCSYMPSVLVFCPMAWPVHG